MWKSTRKALIGGFVVGTGFMWGALGYASWAILHLAIGGAYVALAVIYAREERQRVTTRAEDVDIPADVPTAVLRAYVAAAEREIDRREIEN